MPRPTSSAARRQRGPTTSEAPGTGKDADMTPVDGRNRPRIRSLPRPKALQAKVTEALFLWAQEAARAEGLTVSQWLLELVEEAHARTRLTLPRADPAGVTLVATGDGVNLLVRPLATSELELVLRARALSLSLPLDGRDLRRVAGVLEREAARLSSEAPKASPAPQAEITTPTDVREGEGAAPTGGRRPTTTHFVTPAPGFYGAAAAVVSSHRTRYKAVRAADRLNQQAGRGHFVVRLGPLRKGDPWTPDHESRYPQYWP